MGNHKDIRNKIISQMKLLVCFLVENEVPHIYPFLYQSS